MRNGTLVEIHKHKKGGGKSIREGALSAPERDRIEDTVKKFDDTSSSRIMLSCRAWVGIS